MYITLNPDDMVLGASIKAHAAPDLSGSALLFMTFPKDYNSLIPGSGQLNKLLQFLSYPYTEIEAITGVLAQVRDILK